MNMLEAASQLPPKIGERTTVTDESCWLYDGTPGDHGYVRYGQIRLHVLSYRTFVGEVPDGHVLDHICHDPATCAGGSRDPHRRCWNPAHLSPVSRSANISRQAHPNARKTYCKRGHELSPENVYMNGNSRQCKPCQKVTKELRKARQVTT